MQTYSYAARIECAGPDEYLVSFPAIPEALTAGATPEDARREAADCLAAAVETYLSLGRALPDPSPPRDGEVEIPLDPALAARAVLGRAMSDQRVSKVRLAQLMNRDEKAVRRILSGKGASLDLTIEALRAVGLRPALAI